MGGKFIERTLMQKIILDTIEELNKNYIEYTDAGVMVYFTGKNDGECGVDLDDFIKQALTKSFEAGQKSREKEFERVLKNTPYTTQTDGSTSGFIERVIKSLSLTKELK
jgi:hypothetical protein